MPSNDQVAAYVQQMPRIYRDVLAAFPDVEPGRKAGYGLAFQTLAAHFANQRREYALGAIQQACNRLAEAGFIEIKNTIFAHPTELGEQMIAVLTNRPPAPVLELPPLPAPTW